MGYIINVNLGNKSQDPATTDANEDDLLNAKTVATQKRQLIILGSVAVFLLLSIVIISRFKKK